MCLSEANPESDYWSNCLPWQKRKYQCDKAGDFKELIGGLEQKYRNLLLSWYWISSSLLCLLNGNVAVHKAFRSDLANSVSWMPFHCFLDDDIFLSFCKIPTAYISVWISYLRSIIYSKNILRICWNYINAVMKARTTYTDKNYGRDNMFGEDVVWQTLEIQTKRRLFIKWRRLKWEKGI